MRLCPHCQTELTDESIQDKVCGSCQREISDQDDFSEPEPGGGTIQLSDLVGAVPEEGGPEPPGEPAGEVVAEQQAETIQLETDSAKDPPASSPGKSTTNVELSGAAEPLSEATTDHESDDPANRPLTIEQATQLLESTGLVDGEALTQYWSAASSKGQGQTPSIQGPELHQKPYSARSFPHRSLARRGTPDSESADYCIETFIAEGAMGKVSLALQNSLGRHVAIKEFKKGADYTPDKLRQKKGEFLQEAVITGELDHPNILPIHDVGVADENVFYSMKYIRGSSWEQVRPHQSIRENIDVLLSVCDAVAFAHSKNVVHRDLKPSNVMLGDYGEVLVADWGTAIKLGSGVPFRLQGTAGYAAPEIIQGPYAAIGNHSDVYLLGAILYEIVVGSQPHLFPGDTSTLDVVQHAARNEIAPVDEAEQTELLAIAMRAMDEEPANRYASVELFQKALQEYLKHEESVIIADRAIDQLSKARETRAPADFSRAIVSFEDALSLWKVNSRALQGLREAKIAYAENALDSQDFELGLSIVDPDDQANRVLYDRLKSGQTARDTRQRRLKFAGYSAAALLLILISGGIVFNQELRGRVQERDRALAEKNAAMTEVEKKRDELAESETQLTVTVQNLRAAEGQLQTKVSELETAQGTLQTQKNTLQDQKNTLQGQKETLEEQQRALEIQTAEIRRQLDAKRRANFLTQITLVKSRLEDDDVAFGLQTLEELATEPEVAALRDWECRRFVHACKQVGTFITDKTANGAPWEVMAASQDGRIVTVANELEGARVQLWRWEESGDQPVPKESWLIDGLTARCASIGGNGEWVAVGGGARGNDGVTLEVRPLVGDDVGAITRLSPTQLRAPNQLKSDPSGAVVNGLCFDEAAQSLFVAGGEDFGFRRFRRAPDGWQAAEILYYARAADETTEDSPADVRISIGHRIACTRDGQIVAAIGNANRDDGTGHIILWNLRDETRRGGKEQRFENRLFQSSHTNSANFNDVALSPGSSADQTGDSFLIAAAGHDGRVMISDDPRLDGELITLPGHRRPVRRVAFNQDGSRIVSSGDDLAALTWSRPAGSSPDASDLAGWREVRSMPPVRLRGHRAAVADIGFGPAGRIAALSHSGDLRSWQPNSVRDDLTIKVEDAAGAITAAMDPSGKWLVVGGEDGVLRRYAGPTSHEIGSAPMQISIGHPRVAAPNVRMLAEGCEVDGRRFLVTAMANTLCLWDADTGHWLDRVERLSGQRIFQVARNAGLVLVGQDQESLQAFQIADGRLSEIRGPIARRIFGGFQPRSLALSGDGRRAAGLASGTLRQFETVDGQSWRETGDEVFTAGSLLGFTGDAAHLVMLPSPGVVAARPIASPDNETRLSANGQVQNVRTAKDQSSSLAIASTDESGNLANGILELIDASSGEIMRTIPGISLKGMDFDLSADGTSLVWSVPGGMDESARLAINNDGSQQSLSAAFLGSLADISTVRYVATDEILVTGAGPDAAVARIVAVTPNENLTEQSRLCSRGSIIATRVSDDGNVRAATDKGMVYDWDFSIPDAPRIAQQFSHEILQHANEVAFVGERSQLVARQGGDLYELRLDEGSGRMTVERRDLEQVLDLHAGAAGIALLTQAADGQYVALTLNDDLRETSRFTFSASDERLVEAPPIVSLSDDGTRLAALISGTIHILRRIDGGAPWEPIGPSQLADLNRRAADATSVAFTPPDDAGIRRLLVGDARGGVSLWQLPDPAAEEDGEIQEMLTWTAHRHAVARIDFAQVAEAKYLLTVTDHGECKVWPAAAEQINVNGPEKEDAVVRAPHP